MKKTLIALALTALPVAAMADVTLYGQIKGGIAAEQTRYKVGGTKFKSALSGTDKSTDTVVRDFGSRIGFKGEEDLGNGLKTIWQVEQNVSLGGNTSNGWSNRETFIGLQGEFGKIRVGHLKNVFDEQSTIDPWEYSSETPLGLGVFTRHEKRVGGASVKYNTPDLAGFTASLQYRTKANGRAAGDASVVVDNTDPTNPKISSFEGRDEAFLGLAYENSGFFAKYGFGHAGKAYADNNGKFKSGQLHRLEGGYDANNLFVSMAYQYGKGWEGTNNYFGQKALFGDARPVGEVNAHPSNATVSIFPYWGAGQTNWAVKTKELAVTAAYTMGAVTPRISYAHGWDLKNIYGDVKFSNTKYDQVVVGADYSLSKRTTALVSAGWLKQGLGEADYSNVDGTVYHAKDSMTKKSIGVGLKHVF